MPFPILGTPKPAFFDSSGSPLVSGTLAILDPADDTNKASYPTYDDAVALTNANSNPITLDSRGETTTELWGLDGEDYKLTLKDSAGATIWTADDVFMSIKAVTKYGETAQTLTDAGAVTLTESTTFLVTTGAAAITLADGAENQHKLIVMKTDAGAATLTPTNLSNGTTIIFDDVGDSASLWFIDGSWNFIGGSATLTGATADTATTFTSGDATPTVSGGETFITAGTTAITDFDDGVVGQTIKILAASNITITDGAPINLNNAQDFAMVSGETLTLHMFNDQVWEEIARSGLNSGNWTPTYTGFSADPTGTANWSINGSTVHIRLGFTTGTSDATTMTVSNLPSNLTPSLAQIVPIVGLHDNTADSAAVGSVLVSGTTLTFGLNGDNVSGGGFTASGTKGLQNASISFSYSLM
jgi:hypothetical protein